MLQFGWVKKLGKIIKISVFLAVSCLLNFNLFSQSNNSSAINENSVSSEVSQNGEERFQGLFTDTENDSEDSSDVKYSSPSGIWIFVKMILFLAIVIALIYVMLWFFKRNSKAKNDDDPFLRSVSSINLAPGKSVQIVTFMNKAFIVGVSDNSVNLISEIDGNENEANREMINAMNLYSDKQNKVKKPRSFNDILSIFMPNGKKDEHDLFESARKSTEQFVNRQHERFENQENDKGGI